jgi:hypothetical protein
MTAKNEDVELHADAWERFERGAKSVAKAAATSGSDGEEIERERRQGRRCHRRLPAGDAVKAALTGTNGVLIVK